LTVKLSDYVASFVSRLGAKHVFMLSGGGAMHLNDSKTALGSRVDRHENIGRGWIGREGFRALVNHARLRRLGAFIETPHFGGDVPDRRNLDLLKSLRVTGAKARSGR